MTKNNRKITSTITLASIVAVALLTTFAVATVEQIEALENDKPKKYTADIISSEVTDVYYSGDTKVQRLKVTIEANELPTFEELVEANQNYYDWLETNFGDAGSDKVKELKAKLKTTVENRPNIMTVNMVRIGEHSILFGDESYDSPMGNALDPVNMVFYEDATTSQTDTVIDTYAANNWGGDGVSPQQYVLINNVPHGGTLDWVESDHQQYTGNIVGQREHIRLFGGDFDTHGVYDDWSVGTAHQETWNWGCLCHQIDSWETAESDLTDDLDGQTGVGSIGTYNQGNSGYWQGKYNDGTASLIELT